VTASLGQSHRTCDLGRLQKLLDQPEQLGPIPRRARLRIENKTDVQKRKGIKSTDLPMKRESSEASSLGFSSAPSPRASGRTSGRTGSL
jgi:hypothetical protein